jgi:ankyrin repeat protein
MAKLNSLFSTTLMAAAIGLLMVAFNGYSWLGGAEVATFQGKLAPQMAQAIQHGRTPKLKKLIDEGGDINAMNNHGTMTLLYWALKRRRVKAFQVLLAAGAKPIADADGEPIMSAVVDKDNADKFLTALFDAGISPNEGVGERTSPLEYAIGQDQLTGGDYSERLIQHGADVNHQNRDGDTPLHYAALAGYPEMIRTLLEAGAKPHVLNKQDVTFQAYLRIDLGRPKSTYSKRYLQKFEALREFLRKRGIPVNF